jgi:hypothetical protein
VLQASFFGSVVQISRYAAPADTIATWLSHVRNSERYKQEGELVNGSDLAHMVVGALGDRLAFGIQHEAEWLKRRTKTLDAQLSTLLSMQLKVPDAKICFKSPG